MSCLVCVVIARLGSFGLCCCLLSCLLGIFSAPTSSSWRMITWRIENKYFIFHILLLTPSSKRKQSTPTTNTPISATWYHSLSLSSESRQWAYPGFIFSISPWSSLSSALPLEPSCPFFPALKIDRHDGFHVQTSLSDRQRDGQSANLAVHPHSNRHYTHPPKRPFVLFHFASLFHRLLVGVSSLGMLAMVASLVILFIFGLCTSQFRWKNEYLFPHSTSGFLSNLGLFVHSLAFILFLLSNTVDGFIYSFSP